MKLTIITAVYNGASTIRDTIDSVLTQNVNDIEYIIVDGMSIDGTADIVESYDDKRIKYIREPDRGIYDAMNKGIRSAAGDVIGIINSDDFYVPGILNEIMSYFAQYSDVDIIHGNTFDVDQKGRVKISKPHNLDSLKYGMTLRHPTCFVKKNIYKKIWLFDQQFHIAADYDFLLRCYMQWTKFFYVDKVFVRFRRGGISDTNRIESCREQTAVRKKNKCRYIILVSIVLFVRQWKWLVVSLPLSLLLKFKSNVKKMTTVIFRT